jgi:hypothetical protein
MQQLKCVVGGASRNSRGARHIEFGEHFEKVAMADIHASAQKQKMDSKALSSYFGESSSNGGASPCRTMCSRWPTSELPPTCVTAAWCGPITIMPAREVGALNITT